jgi:DNA-3-methyladenine glycosylase
MTKLPYSFYQQDDVVSLAQQLLGKELYSFVDGKLTGGIIVETEAYNGVTDKASHAYGARFTPRTATMYENGGIAYVYLCYGMHYLFNVVAGGKGNPLAILIRGIEPVEGIATMLTRRNMQQFAPRISAGPGSLSKALGIDKALNAKDLQGDELWIADSNRLIESNQVVTSPRVGVDYAAEDALLPWRFYIKGNKFVSKPNS